MSFGIKHLLAIIAIVAVGLAGLLNARWPAAQIAVEVLMLLVVVAMAYGVWFTTGAARAFRIGFLGWWLLCSVPLLGLTQPGTAIRAGLELVAPVFRPADFNQNQVLGGTTIWTPPPPPWGPGGSNTLTVSTSTTPVYAPTGGTPMWGTITTAVPSATLSIFPPPAVSDEASWRVRYFVIGQCLAAVLLGLCGGWVTAFLYRRRERQTPAA